MEFEKARKASEYIEAIDVLRKQFEDFNEETPDMAVCWNVCHALHELQYKHSVIKIKFDSALTATLMNIIQGEIHNLTLELEEL